MIDLIIRGGQVVSPGGVGDWDVAIQGEKIAALAQQGTLPGDVGRIIDATGKIVVPGGIEPHAHVGAPVMHHPESETAPPDQVSRGALFGGTTTVTDFAICNRSTDILQAIEGKHARWRGNSYCDYSYHCTIRGDPSPDAMAQVAEAIQAGFPTFKIFTTNVTVRDEGERGMMGMGHISALMELVSSHNGLVLVHAEDDDIVQYMTHKLTEEERNQWFNVHEVHNNMSEDISFHRVLRVAQWVGAPAYFVHVSAREGVDAIREARSRGHAIYGETLHNYACFTYEDYKKPDGMKYHTYPSLKSEEDRLTLWNGLINGGISTMGTDEYCTDLSMKLEGRTINDVTGGHNGTETRMGITFSEGVSKKGMSLERFVDVTSANAARIMGYYPRKGAIAPGSDADIVLIDPAIRRPITMDDIHLGDYSIWEGWEIQGWPVTTILRGKVVVENGQLLGKLGDGQFVPRKIAGDILSRPAC